MFLSLAAATAAAPAFAQSAPAHEVAIVGAPKNFGAKLDLIAELKKEGRIYPTRASLRRAADRDRDAFVEALANAGYYNAAANFTIETLDDGDHRVRFEIEPGALFTISEYEVLYRDDAPGRPVAFADAGVKTSGAADGASLRDAQQAFLDHLRNNGYPAAAIITRRAIANTETGRATAVFEFASGPKATFGALEFNGLEKAKPVYLESLAPWEIGEPYEREKTLSYRNRLAATGLFREIDIAPATPDDAGAAPIIVTVEERKPRTIGAGLSYSTAEGPGARVFFENRNIFGRGENFRVELQGSEIRQSIDFDFIRPMPRVPGEAFANFTFANETTDAFDARTVALAGGFTKRWFDDRLETRGAIALETSNVRSADGEERTFFVSLPLTAIWDTEDSLLNPTKGVRASWSVTPYTGTDTFTRSEIAVRSRTQFGADDRFTLAGRARVGATFGTTLDDLPRNRRFFAGGGGSVRGYAFQEAGPLDANGAPVGGRSLIDGAIELRGMVTDAIQLAGFVDAGTVSATTFPNFSDEIFIGAGGGVRYLTPIGPLRVDIAVPLNKRDTDRGFQLFIALGQPF